jgi:choline dehydrogenase
VLAGRRAIGVSYVRNGTTETALASREIIVACGAFDSPRMLMLSGIGPTAELERHGIDVVQELPGVGRNLQEHPSARMVVRCTRPVSLLSAGSRGDILRYLPFRRGVLASNGIEAAAFVRTRPGLAAPDVELLMVPALWVDEGFTPPSEHGYTIAAVLLTPRSRGSVRLRSADPHDPPVIDTNLLTDVDGADLRALVEGIRIARRINAEEPLASLDGGEVVPGTDATDEDSIAASIRRLGQTNWHPVGTCRMGTDDDAVVDPALRVRGVEGLRIADASILPRQVRGHTNAVAIMIGEKAADLVLGTATPS